jgi:CRP-like cAMP-binding protein
MSTTLPRHGAAGLRLAALALAGAALFGLTACSGIPFVADSGSPSRSSAPTVEDEPGDGGQSTADACALVDDTITQATDEFANISSEDPMAVIDAMQAAAQRIAEASATITNDEVAALLPPLQGMFEQVADVMGAISQGDVARIAEVEELGTSFQQTIEEFQAVCAP